jgi:hypothetical protein
MHLSGLDRPASKPVGGVVAVEVVSASDFTDAVWDTTAGCFVSVNLSAPLARYVFREDGCTYTETSEGTRLGLVRHSLAMEFTATQEAQQALSELKTASRNGLIAIVTMGIGERLLVGYSPRFGSNFPLRIASDTYSSGITPADYPTRTIVLVSEDTETSKPLRVV